MLDAKFVLMNKALRHTKAYSTALQSQMAVSAYL